MHRLLTLRRLSLVFGAVFALAVMAVVVFQRYWLDPGERCEAQGRWYDVETRICAQPIYIPDITGRPAGVTRAQASAEKNRELVDLERRLTAEKQARAAATEAERARVESLTEGR